MKNFWAFALALGAVTTDAVLDCRLVDYCDFLYFEGYPGSVGSRLMSALADQTPRFSKSGGGFLPRFARALQAWGRLAPGSTRAPLPWLHVVNICITFAWWQHTALALLILTVFTCYLRPSEGLSIRVKDVLRPTRTCRHYAIRLHPREEGTPSKTRDFEDGIVLDNPSLQWLGPALLRLAGNRPPEDPLFDLKYDDVKNLFENACCALQIPDASLYRLRHGGASHDRATGLRTIEQIKRRG